VRLRTPALQACAPTGRLKPLSAKVLRLVVRTAGAAGNAKAGLGATRQSEGLLRVRGRARLRTPGPDPSGRSQTSDPCTGRRFERRFEAADHPFADRLAVGLFGISAQDRDEPVPDRRLAFPHGIAGTGSDPRRGLGGRAHPNHRRAV